MTFQEAVKCYRCLLCKGILDELDKVSNAYSVWKKSPNAKNLQNLAEVCVLGEHQKRISRVAKATAITEIRKNLLKIFSTPFADFEDLYAFVNSVIGSIDNIGFLTIYDVSLRIGHILNPPIYPKKRLYLNNSGAMTGARKLLNGRILKPTELFVDFFSYPEAQSVVGIQNLQALPNCLVEDFLCVMHRYLDAGPRGLIQDRDTTTTYKKL